MLARLTSLSGRGAWRKTLTAAKKTRAEAVDRQVNNRRCVERQELAEQKSTDDADAKRPAQLRPGSLPNTKGNAANSAAIVVIRIGRKRRRHA